MQIIQTFFRVSNELGAGRGYSKLAEIDHAVGVQLLKVKGDTVEEDEAWAIVHHSIAKLPSRLCQMISDSVEVVVPETTTAITHSHIVKIIKSDEVL